MTESCVGRLKPPSITGQFSAVADSKILTWGLMFETGVDPSEVQFRLALGNLGQLISSASPSPFTKNAA